MENFRHILRMNLIALMEHSSDLKSANALAKRSKVAQTTVSNILRDGWKGSPNLENCAKLADALGVNIWQLMMPGLDPSNPPAVMRADPKEAALYERIMAVVKETRSDSDS